MDGYNIQYDGKTNMKIKTPVVNVWLLLSVMIFTIIDMAKIYDMIQDRSFQCMKVYTYKTII